MARPGRSFTSLQSHSFDGVRRSSSGLSGFPSLRARCRHRVRTSSRPIGGPRHWHRLNWYHVQDSNVSDTNQDNRRLVPPGKHNRATPGMHCPISPRFETNWTSRPQSQCTDARGTLRPILPMIPPLFGFAQRPEKPHNLHILNHLSATPCSSWSMRHAGRVDAWSIKSLVAP